MKRMIKLTNALGQEVDLCSLQYLGFKVDGLGFSVEHDYHVDRVYSIHKKSKQQSEDFTISVLFGSDDRQAYTAFHDFAAFLDHQPLVMSYTVAGVDEYLRDCRFAGLTKSERIDGLWLEETVTLQFTSPWYQWIEGSISEYVDHEGDGKIYDVTYGYIYEDNPMGNQYFFALQNDSRYFGLQQSSPIEITITAGNQPVHNPHWAVMQGDRILQNDGFLFTIAPGNQLVVSSDPAHQKALLYVAGEEPFNLYQYQDVTKTNFVTVPLGESVLLFDNCKGATITYRMRKEVVLV